MRALVWPLLVVLLAGCLGPSAGTHGLRFPTLTAEWSPPDEVRAVAVGHTEGRDIRNATVEAHLVSGPCPGEHDVPTTWLDREVLEMPSSGRFSFEYRLELDGRVSAGETYAFMVGLRHPDTTPSRGWCVEYVAQEGDAGRPVYP